MKKSVLALTLILCLVFSTACSAGDSTKDKKNEKETEKTEEVKAETEATKDEGKGDALTFDELTVNEQIIVDQDGVVITVKSFENDESHGPTFILQIENTTDKDLIMNSDMATVNGITVDTMLACDVMAGDIVEEELYINKYDLEISGITTIKDIEISFSAYDMATYTIIFESDVVMFSTNVDAKFIQSIDDSGIAVYEESGIRVVMKEVVIINENGDMYLRIFVENSTDVSVSVSTGNVFVNGSPITASFASYVPAGKVDYVYMAFGTDDLKANEIVSINEIEFSLYGYEFDSLEELFTKDNIKISIAE